MAKQESWKINTEGFEFDFPGDKERYIREKTVELALRAMDKIIDDNTTGERDEMHIFYLDIVMKLINRIQCGIESDWHISKLMEEAKKRDEAKKLD